MDSALLPTSAELPEKLTIKQAADLYHITKAAIRLRMQKLPAEVITRTTAEGGKEILLLSTNRILSAWGLPPAPQDTHSTPQGAQVDEDSATSAEQSAESATTTAAEREQLQQLRAEAEALRQELAEAKRETAEALKRAEDLTEQLKSSEAERERLQIQLDGLGAGLELLTRERNTLAASIDTLTAQLAAKDLQIDQLHQLQAVALRAALPAPKENIFARIFGRKREQ